MADLYGRDPEEVGPEHPDDLNARMNFAESRHWYVNKLGYGPCEEPTRKYCYEHKEIDYHQECGADRHSVLHVDGDDRMEHDHGGGDCMCFEGYW